jgi:hypothetical protein
MRFLNEGDKSKAFCRKCEGIKAITYIYRDFVLKNGRRVPNVLQGVCSTCDSVVSIPAQSTPKIQDAIHEKSLPLEIRVPPILEDVLYSIGQTSHLDTSVALKCLIQYYSNKIVQEKENKVGSFIVSINNKQPSWFGTKRSRLSLKISFAISEKIRSISQQLSLNKSEYITGILVMAKEELLENRKGKEAKKFFDSIQIFQDAV